MALENLFKRLQTLAKYNQETVFTESYGWELWLHQLKDSVIDKLSGKSEQVYQFLKEQVNFKQFQKEFLT
ncbi:hypothetical protein KC866_00230 [Patescibacteria group bacterium]|nr:hypothetical protein [Patescibacteria group bacterium]